MKNVKKNVLGIITIIMYFIVNFLGGFNVNIASASTVPLKISIETSDTEVPTGRFVSFQMKYDITKQYEIKEGDTIEIEVPDTLIDVVPIYSKQHFKSVEKKENKIILTFGPKAPTALNGYMSLNVKTNNETTEAKDATIKVKYKDLEVLKSITIFPEPTIEPGTEPGKETRALVKFAPGENGKYYQETYNTGVMKEGCDEVDFCIDVNPKKGDLNNAVVKDLLPYETELEESSIKIYKNNSQNTFDEMENYTFSKVFDKNYLQINFGNIKDYYRICYKVKVLNNKVKVCNSAKIEYIENEQKKIELGDFYLKPQGWAGAINGYKSVDKSVISNKSDDQIVTYTLTFENDNTFEKDSIGLVDNLDKRIKFVDAIATDEFAVNYDDDSHSVSVKNSNGDIPPGVKREVKIITDFSEVKPGETVANTVGFNTVTTKKKFEAKFQKVDSINGQPLSGAVFKVLDNNDKEIIDSIVTDENGQGIIELPCEGKYKLVETQAPKDYELSQEKIPFIIDESMEGKIIDLDDIKNEPKYSHINIKKVDEDNETKVLPGAEFQLVNEENKSIDTAVTDINGLAQFKNIIPGTYTLNETKAPKGYIKSEENQEVVVNGDKKLIEITKSNKCIKGQVLVEKVDSKNSEIKLKDAEFQIKDEEGNVVVEKIITGEDGIAKTDLVPGKYNLVETKEPNGYVLDETPISFEVTEDVSEPVKLQVKNNEKEVEIKDTKGQVIVEKIDSNNSEVKLKGAEFQIKDEEGNVVVEKIITGEDGIAKTDLVPGKYNLVETKEPNGYVLEETPISFEVTEDVSEPIKLQVKNNEKEVEIKDTKGQVIVEKIDSNNSEVKLKGAEFQIKDEEGNVVVEKIITGEDGIAKTDLVPGKYNLVETKEPNGYVLDETPISFEVTEDVSEPVKLQVKNNEKEVEIKDTKGQVIVEKIDSNNSEVKLKGAEFQIKDEEGNVVVEKIITGEDGIAKADLVPGKYNLVETKEPNGYVLDETPISFEVTEDVSEPVKLQVKNDMEKYEVRVIKVDKDHNDKKLKDAEFQIKDSIGKLVDTIVTNDNGTVSCLLAPGKYTLQETKSPTGYMLENEKIDFEVLPGEKSTKTFTVENKLRDKQPSNSKIPKSIKGQLLIEKVDSKNNEMKLKDAEFQIKDEKGDVVEKIITGEDGTAKADLVPGKYNLVETKAPNGYILDETPIPFEITKDVSKPVKLKMKNDIEKCEVMVIKVDKDDKSKVLSGAEFAVKNSKGEIVTKLITDKEGKAKISLIPGEYTLEETKAPEKYELSKEVKKFSVGAYQNSTLKIVFENKMKDGTLTVKKVDSDNKDILLEGAIFIVKNKEGKLFSEITTDKNGEATVKLPSGEYIIIEKQAPKGYELNQKEVKSIISPDENMSLQIENTKKIIKQPVDIKSSDEPKQPGDVKQPEQIKNPVNTNSKEETVANTNPLPKTGTNIYNILFIGILLLSSGIIMFMSTKIKIKNSKN